MPTTQTNLFRNLPQLGQLLEEPAFATLAATYSRSLTADALREALDEIRDALKHGRHTEASLQDTLAALPRTVAAALETSLRPSLRPVINATGVILQTNLGRAPLSSEAIEHIAQIASGYCNLEFDLATGERGRRDMHVERLILKVLAQRTSTQPRCEDLAATLVNNCAAATLLALNTLAEGGEVVVSRGELVEIGGGFRIPEILAKSGSVLREVGTTNRTRLSDYASAITPATRLLLRVHRSNFRIEGFTQQPELNDLVELGRRASLPVFEDQGTGCLADLAHLGLPDESYWAASVASGVDLVACSGDKLLGGPQCGILVGSHTIIDRVRGNPIFRALRVDKLTYAALAATLFAYLRGSERSLPAMAMMQVPADEIRTRCEALADRLNNDSLQAHVVETRSMIGGGTTPGASLPSFAVRLRHPTFSESAFAAQLRRGDPAVIARTHDNHILLDLRSVPAASDSLLYTLIQRAANLPNNTRETCTSHEA